MWEVVIFRYPTNVWVVDRNESAIERFHVTSSLSKEPTKFLSLSDIRSGTYMFISVYNLTAQWRTWFENQSLNFRKSTIEFVE